MAAVIGVVVTVGGACLTRRLRNRAGATACTSCRSCPRRCPGWCWASATSSCSTIPDNPLEFLYGTLLILALCNVYHYHAQGFLIATTSINQISRVFDEASTSLGGGFLQARCGT